MIVLQNAVETGDKTAELQRSRSPRIFEKKHPIRRYIISSGVKDKEINTNLSSNGLCGGKNRREKNVNGTVSIFGLHKTLHFVVIKLLPVITCQQRSFVDEQCHQGIQTAISSSEFFFSLKE